MSAALISLLFLVVAIALGIVFKLNVGFVSIGMAYLLAVIYSIPVADVLKGFNTSLFLMLVGVMFMFGVAQTNGTIELLARKIIVTIGKKGFLIPRVLFFVSVLISGLGPGTVPTLAILSVFAVALAKELKVSPLMMASISYLGTCLGGLSPMASTGIIGMQLGEGIGLNPDEVLRKFLLVNAVVALTCAVVLYVGTKAWKSVGDASIDRSTITPFNRQQWLTLAAMGILIVAVLVFKLNVGLVAFILGATLLLFKAGEHNKVLASIAWPTVMMVVGVGVLMGVINTLGGIELLATALASIMTPWTAPATMSVAASALGMFSSSSGVVMPTLISTVPGIVAQVGVDANTLVAAITAGTHVGGMGPVTGGALTIGAYATVYGKEADQDQMYKGLFKWALILSGVTALIALTGIYSIL